MGRGEKPKKHRREWCLASLLMGKIAIAGDNNTLSWPGNGKHNRRVKKKHLESLLQQTISTVNTVSRVCH